MADEKSKLVYSTAQTVPRRGDGRKEKRFQKAPDAGLRPEQQQVTVRLDRKGRGGKSVTVIQGLQLPQKEKEALLRKLKTELGTGGAAKDASLEIQGDQRDALVGALERMGYRPKRSGG